MRAISRLCRLSVGIVTVAVGQNRIHRRADLVMRSFDQAQPKVLRRVLNPEVVLRDPALGGHDLDGAGMRELVVFPVRAGHAGIAETGGLRHRGDGRLLAGEEVPARARSPDVRST